MKNQWLDEMRVRAAVEAISEKLAKRFAGTKTDMEDWSRFLVADLFGLYPQRVRDAIMWRYTIHYEADDRGCVTSLELVKLGWFI